MTLRRRPIDLNHDRAFVLSQHVAANWAGESSWARGQDEAAYGRRWLSTPQVVSFLQALMLSSADPRTIAEVWEADGEPVGYLWVTFADVDGYDLCIAEVRDVVVVTAHRGRGIGSQMLRFAEAEARQRGARVLRSDVGAGNTASLRLHEKAGFAVERMTWEKVLAPGPGG